MSNANSLMNMDPNTPVYIDVVMLERINVQLRENLGREFGYDSNIATEARMEIVQDQMVAHLTTNILSEQYVEEFVFDVEFEYPATWWDAFKEQNFPDWLKKRFPVRYRIRVKQNKIKWERDFRFPYAPKVSARGYDKFFLHDTITPLSESSWTKQ